MPKNLLPVAAAARRLGYAKSIDLVRAFAREGLPVYQPAGPRSRRVAVEDVDAFLARIVLRAGRGERTA